MESSKVTTEQSSRSSKRTKVGTVVSVVGKTTAVIEVVDVERHPKYQKRYTVSRRFHAQVSGEPITKGVRVRIVETRPMSKLKRWRVVERLSKAPALEVTE